MISKLRVFILPGVGSLVHRAFSTLKQRLDKRETERGCDVHAIPIVTLIETRHREGNNKGADEAEGEGEEEQIHHGPRGFADPRGDGRARPEPREQKEQADVDVAGEQGPVNQRGGQAGPASHYDRGGEGAPRFNSKEDRESDKCSGPYSGSNVCNEYPPRHERAQEHLFRCGFKIVFS